MYYKKLDINDFESIQEIISPYVLQFINRSEKLFYNLISDDHLQKFKQDIPELFESIQRTLGSDIILISYLYIDTHSHVPIHTDANNPAIKKRIRLNWPILNGTSVSTIFYQKKSENIQGTLESLSNGVTGYYYSADDCNEMDKFLLILYLTPILKNLKKIFLSYLNVFGENLQVKLSLWLSYTSMVLIVFRYILMGIIQLKEEFDYIGQF